MIPPGFYPPTKRQRLRAWYRRQQAPTPASVDKSVDVVRPRYSAAVWALVAFLAIVGALAYGVHVAAAIEWHDAEGAGLFAIAIVGTVVGASLEVRAAYRWLKARYRAR